MSHTTTVLDDDEKRISFVYNGDWSGEAQIKVTTGGKTETIRLPGTALFDFAMIVVGQEMIEEVESALDDFAEEKIKETG